MFKHFVKDPDATLDFSVDWTEWLGTDTISGSHWTAETGITQHADSHTDTIATVWISGGTDQNDYTLMNQITTVAGRVDERTLVIEARER
jgi:hypothetical protein